MAELKHVFHFGIQAAWRNRAWKLANIRSAVGPVITLALPCIAFMPQNRQDKEKRGSSKTFNSFCWLCCSSVLPDQPEAGLEDERCPLITGCNRAGGQCVCDARHSCLGSFAYPDRESCMKSGKSAEAPPITDGFQSTGKDKIPQKPSRAALSVDAR